MKRVAAICIIIFIFASASSLFAKAPTGVWTFGTHISHIKYEEPGIMQEEGLMYGLNGSYTLNYPFLLRAEGRFSFGQVDYKSNGTGSKNGIDDYLIEVRGIFGLSIEAMTRFFTPYSGFGYRYLYVDLRGRTTTGARGYRREANYFYTPLGIELDGSASEEWHFIASMEYDYFWFGVQNSLLSDAGLGYGDISNTQNSGFGYRGSIKFVNDSEKNSLEIEPYFIYWDINDSDIAAIPGGGYGYEPANNSMEFGVKLGVRY